MQRRRCLILGAVLAAGMRAARARSRPRIVLASLVKLSDSFSARWLELIYTEAFARLGMELEIRYYPPARAAAEAAAGRVDGELIRSFDYVPAKGKLLRVPEPAVFGSLCAYLKRTDIDLSAGWESLRHSPYRIDYRQGYSVLPGRLARIVAPAQLSSTHSTQTGLRKLQVGRSDIYIDYCDIADFALESDEFKGSGIYLASTLERMPFHAFLNPRFAQLVPRLSQILKDMHKSGQINHYRHQALVEYHVVRR